MLPRHHLVLFTFLMGSGAQMTTQVVVPNLPEASSSATEAPSTILEESMTSTATRREAATHTINVGAAGYEFTPNDTKADVGDILEYRFYPDTHWVIRGDFDFPCIPYEYIRTYRTGFSSGPQHVKGITDDAPRFRVRVNNTNPIFFYCGAPEACSRHHMMGVVNPSKNETLNEWLKKANDLNDQMTPGQPFPTETGSDYHVDNYHVDDNSYGGYNLSAGAVASIAISGTTVLILAIGAIYRCGRRGEFEKASRKSFCSRAVSTYLDGTPSIYESQSEREFSEAVDPGTGTPPGNDLMDQAGLRTTNQSSRLSNQESKKHTPHRTTVSTSFSSSQLPKMRFRTLFRRLGHKLNPQKRIKDLENNEFLKEVCSYSRTYALWHFILFHFPPVLVTTALLVLYVENIHWKQHHPKIDELAALQFAAKAQESLILISLTDILLHRIHYGLVSKNGVPLGFLSSPFNISFSLRYLVSGELWSAMLNPAANRYFHRLTAAMIFIFALLCLAAGPSSAIAMLPRYDWWEVQRLPMIFDSSQSYDLVQRDPYTMKLESQHVRGIDTCSASTDINNQSCVNGNLPRILQTLMGLLQYKLLRDSSHLQLQNITVQTTSTDALNRPISFAVDEFYPPDVETFPGTNAPGTLAYAVTPMDSVSQSLLMDFTFHEAPHILRRSEALKPSGKEKWKHPLVAVHCASSHWLRTSNQTSATFSFGDKLYENFTVSLDFNNTLKLLKKNPPNVDNEASHPMTSIMLDIQYLLHVPVTASILFASSFMADEMGVQVEPPDLPEQLFPWTEMHLCLVQARWVEAEIWLYPQEALEIQSHLGFPTSDIMEYIRQKSDHENTIKMTLEWLRDIGVALNVSTPRENPAYQEGMDLCVQETGLFTWGCLPAFLAIYLAEALSQSTVVENSYQEGPGSPSPGPNYTVICNTHFEHVYAYGFGERIGIRLAFTILFLQVFIALIHLAVTVFAPQPWICSVWENFDQLLTLALRSKVPHELSNIRAGVQSSRIWKLMTVLREVGKKRQLEMVVGAPAATLSQIQTTTDVEEPRATQMRIPSAGTEYI